MIKILNFNVFYDNENETFEDLLISVIINSLNEKESDL